jgi:hypothetical protein
MSTTVSLSAPRALSGRTHPDLREAGIRSRAELASRRSHRTPHD